MRLILQLPEAMTSHGSLRRWSYLASSEVYIAGKQHVAIFIGRSLSRNRKVAATEFKEHIQS
jgi:hypothetical protein